MICMLKKLAFYPLTDSLLFAAVHHDPARTIRFGTFDGEVKSTFVEPFVTQAYLENTISAWITSPAA